jgi:hypothetical protein
MANVIGFGGYLKAIVSAKGYERLVSELKHFGVVKRIPLGAEMDGGERTEKWYIEGYCDVIVSPVEEIFSGEVREWNDEDSNRYGEALDRALEKIEQIEGVALVHDQTTYEVLNEQGERDWENGTIVRFGIEKINYVDTLEWEDDSRGSVKNVFHTMNKEYFSLPKVAKFSQDEVVALYNLAFTAYEIAQKNEEEDEMAKYSEILSKLEDLEEN